MGFLANILLDLAILAQSERKVWDKFIISVYFFYYTTKFIFHRLFGIKFQKAYFSDYRIKFYSFRQFYYFFRTIFIHQQYQFLSSNPSPLIVDCGSNLGFSILYFKTLYPEARVIGFEPNPLAYKLLLENIEQNQLKDVKIYNYALSNQKGELELYLDLTKAGDEKASFFPTYSGKDKIRVASALLSEYINESVDFLKLDVEGAEEMILKELAEKDKLKLVKEMIVEYHFQLQGANLKLGEFLAWLEKQGFQYQIQALNFQLLKAQQFQDILIHLFREIK